MSYAVFLKILEFLYTDTVLEIPPDIAVPLLIAAEQYLLLRLKGLCEDAIRKGITCENVTRWLPLPSHSPRRHHAAARPNCTCGLRSPRAAAVTAQQ